MEHFFYLFVKISTATYLLYNIFLFLFGKNRENLWWFLTPRNAVKNNSQAMEPEPETAPYSIVGKSQTVYLERPPESKSVAPFLSEDLKKKIPYDEEPDNINDDVEYKSESYTAEDILSEEERFMPFDSLPEEGESTGMTFQQISKAIDVVSGKNTDKDTRREVAQILNDIGECDLFNFLTAQAENEMLIERLLRENIDDGVSQVPENSGKKRRKIEAFDMDKYV